MRRWPSIWGRRLPDGSCGRPEGSAAHLPPSPVARRRVAPSYLALLRVEALDVEDALVADLDAATPICNACTAAHIFRPDED